MYGWLEVDGRHGTGAYAQAQCGLCALYGRDFRTRTRLLAAADPSILLLLVEGLSAEPPPRVAVRCPLTLKLGKKRALALEWEPLQAVAELQVVLAGEKLLDDRLDRDGTFTRLVQGLLRKDLALAEARLLRRGFPLAALRRALRAQAEVEADAQADLDGLAAPTAEGLALVCGWLGELLALPPEATLALGRVGALLGRTLYLVDALHDYVRDRAKGRFNPLAAALGELTPRRLGWLEARFEGLVAAFAEAFDALPLARHGAVLRASTVGALGEQGRRALRALGAGRQPAALAGAAADGAAVTR